MLLSVLGGNRLLLLLLCSIPPLLQKVIEVRSLHTVVAGRTIGNEFLCTHPPTYGLDIELQFFGNLF